MFKYHKIGEILKPYHSKGELLAIIDESFIEDVKTSKALFIEIDGLPVPFFIEKMEFNSDLLYIKFEEFNNPDDVKKYNSKHLKLRQIDINWDKKDTSFSNSNKSLNGFTIIDSETNEKIIIKKIEEFPHQLMATVENKYNKIQYIPLIDEFINNIDLENKIVHMTLPEGLLDS